MNKTWHERDKSFFVDCANCGKQVLIEDNTSICYWCHKNASKKEVVMQDKEVTIAAAAPTKPKKRGAIGQYYDTNKEAILADYQSLRLLDFLNKWRIAPVTWQQLKNKWEVPNRRRGYRPLTAKSSGANNTQALTEHERYLILLGYQMAVQDFLKADKS